MLINESLFPSEVKQTNDLIVETFYQHFGLEFVAVLNF